MISLVIQISLFWFPYIKSMFSHQFTREIHVSGRPLNNITVIKVYLIRKHIHRCDALQKLIKEAFA